MDEAPLSQQESLEIIQRMINQVKDNFCDDGQLYLFWGWVIVLASLGDFVLIHVFHVWWHFMIWWITWLAVVYHILYLRRRRRRSSVRTHLDAILGVVWMAFFITLIILVAVVGIIYANQGKDFYLFINSLLLALYGLPTFVSGFVLRFKPLKAGGIACWVFCGISAFLPQDYQILLLAAAVVLAWMVPGYLLRSRFKKMNQPQHGF